MFIKQFPSSTTGKTDFSDEYIKHDLKAAGIESIDL